MLFVGKTHRHIVNGRLKELLGADLWPEAVPSSFVVNPNDESEKTLRGQDVIDLMVEMDLEGKRFLDFGCGEGHATSYVRDRGALVSVGFDVKSHDWNFRESRNLKFSTCWDEVRASGPYDAILMFDVLDHLNVDTPIEVLTKARSLLAPDGRMYIRVHPWVSRHAIHQYHVMNKAFIHLVFSPEELREMMPDVHHIEPNTGFVKTPFTTYKGYFDEAGLAIVKQRAVKDTVEPFFRTPDIADRIQRSLGFTDFPEFQLSLVFIDYVLRSDRTSTELKCEDASIK